VRHSFMLACLPTAPAIHALKNMIDAPQVADTAVMLPPDRKSQGTP
jgi:hypothetical protein